MSVVESTPRYAVSASESLLSFEASSTLHPVGGEARDLAGYVQADLRSDGSLAGQQDVKMHVEFSVEGLRSGNGLQDRAMWNVVDSKGFPRVCADLRELEPTATPNRYVATGDITLAGRARRYSGELTFEPGTDEVTVEGALDVDIRDFGLRPPNLLVVKVDPTVKVRLHLVAKRDA